MGIYENAQKSITISIFVDVDGRCFSAVCPVHRWIANVFFFSAILMLSDGCELSEIAFDCFSSFDIC